MVTKREEEREELLHQLHSSRDDNRVINIADDEADNLRVPSKDRPSSFLSEASTTDVHSGDEDGKSKFYLIYKPKL